MNRSTMIESVAPDELVNAIAAAVLDRLQPMLSTANATAKHGCMNRPEIAEFLRCSVSTIDRMQSDGMPSLLTGNTRVFVVADVLEWMRGQTEQAEESRRAKKQAAKAKREAGSVQ